MEPVSKLLSPGQKSFMHSTVLLLTPILKYLIKENMVLPVTSSVNVFKVLVTLKLATHQIQILVLLLDGLIRLLSTWTFFYFYTMVKYYLEGL